MSTDGCVLRLGWLRKSPPEQKLRHHAWKQRWFILRRGKTSGDPDVLEYYKNKHTRKPMRVIDLKSCDQVDAGVNLNINRKELRGSFVFSIRTTERTFYLVAETREDMEKWVESICQVAGFRQTQERGGPVQPTPSACAPREYLSLHHCVSGTAGSVPREVLTASRCANLAEGFGVSSLMRRSIGVQTPPWCAGNCICWACGQTPGICSRPKQSRQESELPQPGHTKPNEMETAQRGSRTVPFPQRPVADVSELVPQHWPLSVSTHHGKGAADPASEQPVFYQGRRNVLGSLGEPRSEPETLTCSGECDLRRMAGAEPDLHSPHLRHPLPGQDPETCLRKAAVRPLRSASDEDDYVPMQPGLPVLLALERERANVHIPPSPGRRRSDSHGSLPTALDGYRSPRQERELLPPPVDRSLKPGRKTKPTPLPLTNVAVIDECPLTSLGTSSELGPSHSSQGHCPVSTETSTSADSGDDSESPAHLYQNSACASPVRPCTESPAPGRSPDSINYVSLDFELCKVPGAEPSPSAVRPREEVHYVQVDEVKTQALQKTAREWALWRQASEPPRGPKL
ncbi:PREDICTED: GRB2-associated-binding protein 2-like [Propithecus coquereli]|uniref:GRB2-associated-binding protein 2-like n=1 Tax=Propithecus coquereli TaxID=379532 RepID=UPI00063EF2E7|nr:PREDICTED: GRB2-associated-binding protein 2-like [Propithecus coquereli]